MSGTKDFSGNSGRMMPRRKFNPKRRVAHGWDIEKREKLAARVSYTGNPEHKEAPGDFQLTPPVQPRPDKSKCDWIGILDRATALRLLKEGARRGLVSRQVRGTFPQNIWAVTDGGDPVEAQLENESMGTYHGYPMPATDPFREVVIGLWGQHEQHV